jgi:DNA-binding GntR family transcriptional regulator
LQLVSEALVNNRLEAVTHNLSDLVYDEVRDLILGGEIAPGSPVRQEALAAELGVSKIPLREALTRLKHDGLVSSTPNRGYVVRPMTANEAEEIFALRLGIEPKVTAQGALNADAFERQSAKSALQAVAEEQDMAGPRVAVLNREFHLALVRPSKKDLTVELLDRLHVLAERYVRAHLIPHGRDRRARAEHAALFKAWTARDVSKVERLVSDHIDGTLADLRDQLRVKAAVLPAAQRIRRLAKKRAVRSPSQSED